ncbi:MAG: modulated transcriptional regulator, MtlR family [Pelosinus sp.]|nr:modulated transcriptional regulator, MtlR family [Pelosinus sp.]
MNITSRQRMILNILLTETQGITVNEIAEQIEVSTRTIHRELNDIESLLAAYQLQLTKKAGIGIFIEGDVKHKEVVKSLLHNQTVVEYSSKERKLLILCQLLESKEPIKLVAMARDFKATISTISNDLDELDAWIQTYDLTLIRRRGYGVELYGTEAAIRKAMSTLISENLDEFDLLGIAKENIYEKPSKHINTVSERLLGLIEKEKLVIIENSLRDLKNHLPYPLADSSFIGLAIHLALAIERIEKGEKISFDEVYLKELERTPEFEISEKIVQTLRTRFQLDIPIAEVGYITMHLRGAKLRSAYDDYFEFKNVELALKVNKLISFCEDKLDVVLNEDPTLIQGLLTHIEPAIFRIQKNMKIRNPLLDEIKSRYNHLFQIVKAAVETIFTDLSVPEEEIGYLVMHIGASLERKRSEYNHQYRALVVCASGIGSSKILASRIKKELPAIGYAQNISMFDVEKIAKDDYDIIISTVHLSISSRDYILVSPLLTRDDVKNITIYLGKLGDLGDKQQDLQSVFSLQEGDLLGSLKNVQSYIDYTIKIIEEFACCKIDNQNLNVEEVVGLICEKFKQNQTINNKQELADKLLEREKLGGLGISNIQLALFHTRNKGILKPALMLYFLKTPMIIKSMDNKFTDIDKILVLLAPETISKEGLEILSEISSLLVEEEIIEVLACKDQERIRNFFLKNLYKYIMKKIKGRDRV